MIKITTISRYKLIAIVVAQRLVRFSDRRNRLAHVWSPVWLDCGNLS